MIKVGSTAFLKHLLTSRFYSPSPTINLAAARHERGHVHECFICAWALTGEETHCYSLRNSITRNRWSSSAFGDICLLPDVTGCLPAKCFRVCGRERKEGAMTASFTLVPHSPSPFWYRGRCDPLIPRIPFSLTSAFFPPSSLLSLFSF